MSGMAEALTDMSRLLARARALGEGGGEEFVRFSGEVMSKLSEELRKFDHPPMPSRYKKLLIMPDGSVRFYIATGVFYDSTPGPESDAFIEMVNEFYRDHTELAKLNCEEAS